ncbi:hypothetical protein R2G56_08710 [Nitratireductor aquimarinus]|uniref:Uncharacterized protein n=1 Tax=Nitratireductor aquimarinus TaxID=889300 RepID=A0ABU4AJE1_9HYPH|nr:hypothetical protein [Nitratireductor aquimarinus]MDV6226364.1 hypothetical protein [Nitratireductor aquimarinus]
MTAPIDRIDGITKRMTSALGQILMEEAEKLREPPPRVIVRKLDEEIMSACRSLGAAYDDLQQAKYSGGPEVRARRNLEQAARRLRSVMRRHGRFP